MVFERILLAVFGLLGWLLFIFAERGRRRLKKAIVKKDDALREVKDKILLDQQQKQCREATQQPEKIKPYLE